MSTSQKRAADMERLLRAVLQPASREHAAGCPEAGVLAAFVEGSLTATEQSALDSHIAGCGRCQDALAVLSHDLQEEEDAALETGWFTWVTRPRLRWFVPIGAAATVAVVFFATRPVIAPEGKVPAAEVVQMAQAPSTPAAVPVDTLDARRDRSAAVPEKTEFAGAARRDDAAKSVVGQAPALKETREVVGDEAQAGQLARDKKPVAPAAEMLAARVASDEKRAAVAAPAAPAPVPVGAQMAAAPVEAAGAARKPAAGEANRAELLATGVRKATQEFEAGPTAVSAPGGSVQWRFGAGGRVWRSGDAGESWHAQPSGVTADLLAGAAPSPITCWIVGTAGTVLLTTNGERWERRQFPVAVDLVAVAASSARAVTVTTRDGRRFETLDGGATWIQR